MLKRLDIQGFKTFAARTTVELEAGITAVVGPNGSGKSNLADAVRWVLGEQSLRALRGRRSEDIIFAGGGQRTPSGMAEVVITFDNRDGKFGLPFAEVSVTRRAYRSGENEYAINRERSRYRDVAELLSRASLNPNGHVVVGQGMADSALSLRPEERRAFIEDAAGISHYQTKLSSARERLAQTEANVLRATDLLSEIAARLPELRARADRAREASQIQLKLRESLIAWYGAQWRDLRSRSTSLAEAAESARLRLISARERLDSLRAEERSLAGQIVAADRDLEDVRRERESSFARTEALRRVMVETRERLAGLRHRIDDSERELAALAERTEAEEQASIQDLNARAEVAERLAGLHQALAAADLEARERSTRRRQAVELTRALEREVAALSGQIAANRASLDGIVRRRQTLVARQQEAVRASADAAASGREAAERRQSSETAVQTLEEEARAIAERARSAGAALETAARQREERLERQRGSERSLQALETRRDMLKTWHDGLSGYYSGVKAVLQSARSASPNDRLSGIVGPVAELVRAPANLELAVETALGGHLQDLVVERWSDAEAAIQMLKRTGAGRATFLPLDSLRVTVRQAPRSSDPEVLGLASDLVSFDPAHVRAIQHLLGQTLVVTDLAVARRVLASLSGGWQIVTVGGEIVRSSGAITGGADRSAGRGVLGRERELRDVPSELEMTRAILAEAKADADRAAAILRQAEADVAALRRREQELIAAKRVADSRLQAAVRDEALAEQSHRSRAREEDRLAADELQLATEEEALRRSGEALRPEQARSREALTTANAGVSAIDDEERAQSRQFAESRAAQAAAEQEQRALDQSVERHTLALRALQSQSAERAARRRDLGARASEAEAQLESSRSALAEAETAIRALDLRAKQAQSLCARLGECRQALDESTAVASADADALARESADASLGRERAAIDRETLRRQVEHDLGRCEEAGGRLTVVTEDGNVCIGETAVPPVEELAACIADLRRRLRTLGPVSEETVEEHGRLAERHDFLLSQFRDLEAGGDSIREAIDELEGAIRTRFDQSFAVMSASFSRNFATLFGGGVGKLVLTDPDSPESTGINVVASVPGRRIRDLAQLSGGERALTAVALIFAVLEANPTPVCVLDEVDAALDEANVGRFCSLLRERSERTQFVVITHNRRTMESAAALYGVTMEDKATSRVISLRLAGVPR